MSLLNKLEILADSAKYDVSCASSGTKRNPKGRLGRNTPGGCCHSWSSDGRCISLLKILMSNICIYDCAYCVNRISNDIPRAIFTPDELAGLTVNFYRKNYIEGLFLSSAVTKSPDFTMELLLQTVRLLRKEYRFGGYVHLKLIPGASWELIKEGGRLADRVSVNIELPTRQSLALLAPQKTPDSILRPMKSVGALIQAIRRERKKTKKAPLFSPAGQSTQLIVGATPESDRQIMMLSESLYDNMNLKRVYYSAYVPVNSGRNLPSVSSPPLLREHRLYQADWLIRFYGFSTDEFLDEKNPNLNTDFDPKTDWALKHMETFPVEINRADYPQLLRIPGIGIRSAGKILTLRKVKALRFEDLKKLRIVLKRAQYFITLSGRYFGDEPQNAEKIQARLRIPVQDKKKDSDQLDFFTRDPNRLADELSAITGEL
ncbi:MAG: putative DNA modification/repair radical SAM protein [Candidatus Aureabacteria bacterium]|nr:putative DNA modification/repair radical SAM protein [Candidatus Auribacterota bacterium]